MVGLRNSVFCQDQVKFKYQFEPCETAYIQFLSIENGHSIQFKIIPVRYPHGHIKQVTHVSLKCQEAIQEEYVDLRVIPLGPDEMKKGVCRQSKVQVPGQSELEARRMVWGGKRWKVTSEIFLCHYYQNVVTCVHFSWNLNVKPNLYLLTHFAPYWLNESRGNLKLFLTPVCDTIDSE